jgi:hypothetical protein
MSREIFPVDDFLQLRVLVVLAVLVGVGMMTYGFNDRGVSEGVNNEVRVENPLFSRNSDLNYEPNLRTDLGLMSNSGLYVTDMDNSGYEDLLVTGGQKTSLFRNDGGEFVLHRDFDVASAAHFFDYDADGDEDLLLMKKGGAPELFENNGDGEFTSADTSFESLRMPLGAASGDLTGNGCLDVVMVQNGDWQAGVPMQRGEVSFLRQNHPEVRPTTKPGNKNFLYENKRTGINQTKCGVFKEASQKVGLNNEDWSLVTSIADFSGNGLPDIHIGNDFNRDLVYLNTNGSLSGLEKRELGPSSDRNAMSSVAKPILSENKSDIFVSNVYSSSEDEHTMIEASILEGNNLFVYENDTFTDYGKDMNIDQGGWGWGATIEDLTNNGYFEVVQTTSSQLPYREFDNYSRTQFWEYDVGKTEYKSIPKEVHNIPVFDGRSVVAMDIDNSGWLDLVFNARKAGEFRDNIPGIYENQGENIYSGRESLQVKLNDPNGIVEGSSLKILFSDGGVEKRFVTSNSGFLSQGSKIIHIGGLDEKNVSRIEVSWPDGEQEVFSGLKNGERYFLIAGGDTRVIES